MTSRASATRSLFLSARPATAAIEIASGRVTVVEVGRRPDGLVVTACASTALPVGVVTPSLIGTNIHDTTVVTAAVREACESAGIRPPRRAALVIPDSAARLSLLTFEELPPKTADVDQLVRWQIKKATPFPLDNAQVTHPVSHQEIGATTLAAIAARREAVVEYEQVVLALGIHPGVVDLASVSVLNAALAGDTAPAGDWLMVCVAKESTVLAIVREGELVFYRHRYAIDEEPLGALVHQTAMYYEDRLEGGKFARVWLCGASWASEGGEAIRREMGQRLKVEAQPVDVRGAVAFANRIGVNAAVLDAVAAPLGALLRERAGA